jgi:hypothetical protein
MSTGDRYNCIQLANIGEVLYDADYNTSNCAMLSNLNNIVKNNDSGGITMNNTDSTNNINTTTNSTNMNNNINFNNFKIMEYSGSPILILLFITLLTNIFLAIPLVPVFIAGNLYIIILILILAVLCVYMIHQFLFQE